MANAYLPVRRCASFLLCICLLTGTGSNVASAQELGKWQALRPTIEKVLKQQGYQCPSQPLQANIVATANFAVNNIAVALVSFCPASTYTQWIAVMWLKSGRPVPMLSRQRNGATADLVLGQGSSQRHGLDVHLVPEQNAIQDIRWDADPAMHVTSCTVDVYVWDANAGRSDWSSKLTDQVTLSYCSELQHRLLKEQ